jgi:hypothetical protein
MINRRKTWGNLDKIIDYLEDDQNDLFPLEGDNKKIFDQNTKTVEALKELRFIIAESIK